MHPKTSEALNDLIGIIATADRALHESGQLVTGTSSTSLLLKGIISDIHGIMVRDAELEDGDDLIDVIVG